MIRKPLPTDVFQINELGSYLDKDFSKKNDINAYINNNLYIMYVIEQNNAVVGFIMLTAMYETMELLYLVIDAKYRHMGYGTELLNEVINHKNKESRIILEVRANNDAAIAFYQKNNFKIINNRHNYYGNNIDAIIMERSI